MTGRAAVFFLGFYTLSLLAKSDFSGDFASLFNEKKSSDRSQQEHFGLSFLMDSKTTECLLDSTGVFLCHVGQDGCQVTFQRLHRPFRLSLPLIRLARHRQWVKENPSLSQYVEGKVTTGEGELLLQSARGYGLNSASPLLLRAFDVVMQEDTVVSIVTKCDFRLWPTFAKEINSIETSLKKVAKN